MVIFTPLNYKWHKIDQLFEFELKISFKWSFFQIGTKNSIKNVSINIGNFFNFELQIPYKWQFLKIRTRNSTQHGHHLNSTENSQ